jgi:iron complex outermembrane receptor protein
MRPLLLATLIATLAAPAPALAQSKPVDLTHASIEDLMNIEITSASHKQQRTGDVAGAISVITHEDIRRSGMTTIPELLRMVPGVQVARINSNKWAVTARGFNNLFADKLLVLVDGRTVYDRLNSGLFWETADVPLDQIERIEVIRGPGGAVWGANAVNGVINIVTRSAADLRGAAIGVGVGTLDGTHTAARFGGTLGRVDYRVYSQWSGHGESQTGAARPADDRWHSQSHGFRLDWSSGRDTFMAEGGGRVQQLSGLWRQPAGPVASDPLAWEERTSTQDYDLLGRWTHHRDDGSSLQVQSSLDIHHNETNGSVEQRQADIDAQYHTGIGKRHDVVVGAGYRLVDEQVNGQFAFFITPDHVRNTVVNLFAQDEMAVGRQVHVTLGAKVERDSYVGWGVQPTARVMWTIVPRKQHLWAAVSRALRTPSLLDVSGRFNFTSFIGQGGLPVLVGALGNPGFQSEEVLDTEGGYRIEIGTVASVDVTAFVGRYDKLKTSEPLAPRLELGPAPAHLFIPVRFENLLAATSSGVEISAHWMPAPWWRLDGTYSTFHLTPDLSAASHDATAAAYDGDAPSAQWHARSAFSLTRGVELDAMLFHSGALANLDVGAYTRADARLSIPLTRGLSVAIVGQNLFDPAHAEYAGQGAIVTPTLIPRSASIALSWKPRP